jgi:putative NADH-flavin reductase
MEQHSKIAVIGGGGRTGNFVVSELLARGYRIKLLLRNPDQAQKRVDLRHPFIEIIQGDAVEFGDVQRLISGCSAIISTVGQRDGEPLVASQATSHILKMLATDPSLAATRYVVLAGITVDTPFDKKGIAALQATQWMKSNFSWIYEDRQEFYQILARSDAAWTLVRVPLIGFTGNRGVLAADLFDAPSQQIDAVDIAIFMVDQLESNAFLRQAPFIGDVSNKNP